MSCTKPLKGFEIGKTKNGKAQYLIVPFKTDHIEYRSGSWHKCNEPIIGAFAEKVIKDCQVIPCGQCVGCRLDYSRNWSIRCLLEMQKYPENCFITLTYDDEHAPKSFVDVVDEYSGEVYHERKGDYLSLDKTDLQKFWKRLRKKGIQCRYFACGEYGDTTQRPHYHAIIFGYRPSDLRFYKRNANGDILYRSDELACLWSRGDVIVGDATYESCAYVARYVMKKLKGKGGAFYDAFGIEKEFVTMSRKPGIARDYYELHKDTDLFLNDNLYISTPKGSKKFKPFRYFKNLYEVDYPGDIHWLTDRQKELMDLRQDFKNTQSSKKLFEMLEDEDFILNEKSKKGRNSI